MQREGVIMILGKVKDHPAYITVSILFLWFAHVMLTLFGVIPDIWQQLRASKESIDLYIAMLSVSALQASFAGVIVVFGLSTQPQAFRELRIHAGKSLIENWMSISYSGFVSAGLSLIASVMNLLELSHYAPWFFELSVLFCVHGVIRLLWLLKDLIEVVKNDDIRVAQKENDI
jgi:hypothetical protein